MCVVSPADEAEDVEGQVEDGEGSEGDEEQHDSQTPPSPDGQTGLGGKKQTNGFSRGGSEVRRPCDIIEAEDEKKKYNCISVMWQDKLSENQDRTMGCIVTARLVRAYVRACHILPTSCHCQRRKLSSRFQPATLPAVTASHFSPRFRRNPTLFHSIFPALSFFIRLSSLANCNANLFRWLIMSSEDTTRGCSIRGTNMERVCVCTLQVLHLAGVGPSRRVARFFSSKTSSSSASSPVNAFSVSQTWKLTTRSYTSGKKT